MTRFMFMFHEQNHSANASRSQSLAEAECTYCFEGPHTHDTCCHPLRLPSRLANISAHHLAAAPARSTCFLVQPRACLTVIDFSHFPHDLPSACCYCEVLHPTRSLQLTEMRIDLDLTACQDSTLNNDDYASLVTDVPAIWQHARRARKQGHGQVGSRDRKA